MEHVEELQDGASASPLTRHSNPARRDKKQRNVLLYTGALSPNQRWVAGHCGRFSIDEFGVFRSYARGEEFVPRTYRVNGYRCVRVFFEDESKTWKLGDLVAAAFLGTAEYIFLDGDKTNVRLDNLCRKEAALLSDERWIEGFELQYSIRTNGEVCSFKRNVKTILKLVSSPAKSKRVCLTAPRKQVTVYVDQLMSEYFGPTLTEQCQ